MSNPIRALPALSPADFCALRLRTIFECCKWDPQVEDTSVLAPYPICIARETWSEIGRLAEALAFETVQAENEILSRIDILKDLGLPRAIWKLLATSSPSASGPRVMRFDFHFTPEGWRISEVNSDVPGGFIESDGFTTLMGEHYPGFQPVGQPAARLVESLCSARSDPAVALVHATAYSDDRQVMTYLAQEFSKHGATPALVSPAQIRWAQGEAHIETEWHSGPVDLIYRFFPAEWLPNLRQTCAWRYFFTGAKTPPCNPASALVTQSKRFGIHLASLESKAPTWSALLPETRDPRSVAGHADGWVLKPALGRVGDAVNIRGVTPEKQWSAARRNILFFPKHWVAQRRFQILPTETPDGPKFFCLGVYTVNGRAAGIYARCSSHPVIDHTAQDVAVLMPHPEPQTCR